MEVVGDVISAQNVKEMLKDRGLMGIKRTIAEIVDQSPSEQQPSQQQPLKKTKKTKAKKRQSQKCSRQKGSGSEGGDIF